MLDRSLRSTKRLLLRPVASRIPVSPNFVTAVGLLFGLLSALAASVGDLKLALILWLTNRTLDGLDGEIADVQKSQSDFGGYFDIMADLAVYAAIPLGLAVSQASMMMFVAVAILLSSFYLNVGSWMYLSSVLEKRGQGASASQETTSITMPAGLIEGAETLLLYCLFLIFPDYLLGLFALTSLLVLIGVGQRMLWARSNL